MNVLVTREKEKYQVLADKLQMFGLTPFSLPMIRCTPVSAIISGEYDYGVFTSINSAEYFKPYVERVLMGRVVSVGMGTANALLGVGITTDIIPEEASADGLKEMFFDVDVTGKRFLFAGAASRAGDFHKYLQTRGAQVDLVTIYKTEPVVYEESVIRNFLSEKSIRVITFASPSAAKAMLSEIKDLPQQMICIGKTTAYAVRELGYDCRYPDDFSLDWMVKLITELG